MHNVGVLYMHKLRNGARWESAVVPPHGSYSRVRTGAATAPELFLQLH